MEQVTFTEIRSKLPDMNKRATVVGERFQLVRHKSEEMVALSLEDFENLTQDIDVTYTKKPISFTAIRSKIKDVNKELKNTENTVFVVKRHKTESLVFVSNSTYKTLTSTDSSLITETATAETVESHHTST